MKKSLLYIWAALILASCVPNENVVVTSQSFNSINDEVPLQLVLTTDKSEYKVGEPIMATLKLQNVSNEPILVKKRLALGSIGAPIAFRDVFFLIGSPPGIQNSNSSRTTPPFLTDADFQYLEPGEGFQESWDIAYIYDIKDVGMYYLSAIYQNSHDPDNGPPSWRGEIRSNTISFEVIGP